MPQPSIPVLYFGPLKESGHYLFHDRRRIDLEGAKALGFPVDPHHGTTLQTKRSLDGGYCTGYIPKEYYRRSKPQVEGHALFAHENGMTILGLWDRSVDTRPGCSSTYIALGTLHYGDMLMRCEAAYPARWNLLVDRAPVQLIEILGVERKYLDGIDLAGVEVVS